MSLLIPITNDGAASLNVTTPVGVLTFRTYWQAINSYWLLDLTDGNGVPIVSGMPLLAGCQDLLHGIGDSALKGYSLAVFVNAAGGERNPQCWGATAALILSPISEGSWLTIPDPMTEAATWPV
jgi:hypothetical protein